MSQSSSFSRSRSSSNSDSDSQHVAVKQSHHKKPKKIVLLLQEREECERKLKEYESKVQFVLEKRCKLEHEISKIETEGMSPKQIKSYTREKQLEQKRQHLLAINNDVLSIKQKISECPREDKYNRVALKGQLSQLRKMRKQLRSDLDQPTSSKHKSGHRHRDNC